MDQRIRSGLDPKARRLRLFGLILGGVLTFFGWRADSALAVFLFLAGAASSLTAAVRPMLLAPLERRWMLGARVLTKINTAMLLGLMYYLVIAPAGLIMRLFDDPLKRRWRSGSYWSKTRTGDDLKGYERTF